MVCGVLILCTATAHSQQRVWVNPGASLSYTFGAGGGWTYGVEVSVLWESVPSTVGAVVKADCTPAAKMWKFHAGFEGHPFPVEDAPMGLDVGPTVLLDNGRLSGGLSITPYTGIVLVPFLTLTIRYPGSILFEAGASLKGPFTVRNEGFGDDIQPMH
jgi:hypothetical protein